MGTAGGYFFSGYFFLTTSPLPGRKGASMSMSPIFTVWAGGYLSSFSAHIETGVVCAPFIPEDRPLPRSPEDSFQLKSVPIAPGNINRLAGDVRAILSDIHNFSRYRAEGDFYIPDTNQQWSFTWKSGQRGMEVAFRAGSGQLIEMNEEGIRVGVSCFVDDPFINVGITFPSSPSNDPLVPTYAFVFPTGAAFARGLATFLGQENSAELNNPIQIASHLLENRSWVILGAKFRQGREKSHHTWQWIGNAVSSDGTEFHIEIEKESKRAGEKKDFSVKIIVRPLLTGALGLVSPLSDLWNHVSRVIAEMSNGPAH